MASPVFIEEDVTIFRCFALSASNTWIDTDPYPDPHPDHRITIGNTARPSTSFNGGICLLSCAITITGGSIPRNTPTR